MAPEWLTVHFVDLVQYTATASERPEMVRVQAGRLRLPNGGGVRLASQVVGGPAIYLVPPAAAARLIGIMREGLTL